MNAHLQVNAIPTLPNAAAEFARAAEVLRVATRAWPILPPTTRAEIDPVANQLEGLRRSLIDMRQALQK